MPAVVLPCRQPASKFAFHPERPGEDEATAALRRLARVLASYPRAFDLVLADGLYATARFFNFLLDHSKHALVVFRDERRNLYQDVQALWARVPPQARGGLGPSALRHRKSWLQRTG